MFVRTRAVAGALNPDLFGDAFAVLLENRGDFLAAPADAEPRIVATGRASWNGWVDLIVDPVDEIATRMTARVARRRRRRRALRRGGRSRPSLVKFNDELLDRRYAHAMLVDGNDPPRHRRRPLLRRRHRDRLGPQPRRRARPCCRRQAVVQPRLPGVPAAPADRCRAVHGAEPSQEPVLHQRRPGPAEDPPGHRGPGDLRPAPRRRRRAHRGRRRLQQAPRPRVAATPARPGLAAGRRLLAGGVHRPVRPTRPRP